ncbi:MAG: hypothetical protein J7L69_05185 [Desulfobulbaceae bacterium]|nr:hypothetical protein [Desulfobulbaceae bacterium]
MENERKIRSIKRPKKEVIEWLHTPQNSLSVVMMSSRTHVKKCVLINYKKTCRTNWLCESYDRFRKTHQELIEELLEIGNNDRQEQWTESIAVGSKQFTETIKGKMGIMAKGRKIIETNGICQLREEMAPDMADFGRGKEDIRDQNMYFWDVNSLFSAT